jgi:hypothetical protein
MNRVTNAKPRLASDISGNTGLQVVVRSMRFDHTLICRECGGSHGKAYISYRGVAFNDCFLRNSHARTLIESPRA